MVNAICVGCCALVATMLYLMTLLAHPGCERDQGCQLDQQLGTVAHLLAAALAAGLPGAGVFLAPAGLALGSVSNCSSRTHREAAE
jgi:hypothetical protein